MELYGRYATISELYADVLLFIGEGIDVSDMLMLRPTYEVIYRDTPEDPNTLRLHQRETIQMENMTSRMRVFIDKEGVEEIMSDEERTCYEQVRSELQYGRLVLFVPKEKNLI